MTFDEAWKKIGELSSPVEIPGEAGDAEILESDLSDIFEDLKREYAPTIEMTEEQYVNFINWREHTAGWHMTNCAEWARDEKMATTKAMQAWLHPETIKVIGENNDTATGSRNED